MIILDTNVISESWLPRPNPNVINWLAKQEPSDIFLCAPVVAELAFGAQRAVRRQSAEKYMNRLESLLSTDISDRVLQLDLASALLAGKLRAHREALGRPVATTDMMIAAIALHNNMTLATRNIRDFDGLDIQLVNPFDAV
jgi:toxin FitB